MELLLPQGGGAGLLPADGGAEPPFQPLADAVVVLEEGVDGFGHPFKAEAVGAEVPHADDEANRGNEPESADGRVVGIAAVDEDGHGRGDGPLQAEAHRNDEDRGEVDVG